MANEFKADKNRVRRLNQQLDVWRKNAPEFVQNLENKLEMQQTPNYSKDGTKTIFSARKMTESEYQEQQKIMNYFEKQIGSYTEQFKALEDRLQQEGYDTENMSQEDINNLIRATGDYESLLSELWKRYKELGYSSAQAYAIQLQSQKLSVHAAVQYLNNILGYSSDQEVSVDNVTVADLILRDYDNPFL